MLPGTRKQSCYVLMQAAAELEQLEALSKEAVAHNADEGGAEATDEL